MYYFNTYILYIRILTPALVLTLSSRQSLVEGELTRAVDRPLHLSRDCTASPVEHIEHTFMYPLSYACL